MPITHKARYQGSFYSENGRYHIIKIYDKNYSGTKVPLKIGGGGVKIKYDTSGQEKFSPIVASKCSISLIVEDNVYGIHVRNFLQGLRETYEEGDATVVIWNTGSTQDTPLWSGNILIDLSAKEDVSKPYEVEISATDGIGILKNYDMVATQGSSPYASADTYISDGYQTFIYWIKTILAYCNTPDSDSTDGDVSDYTFSTSVDWWYQDHPTPTTSISPLAYTQCQMMGCYEVTQDGTYKVKSVYDVLESFCKMWGMKVVFWKNRFYFAQLELYNTAETGTFAAPDNVDSQIWTKAGVLSTGRSYLGEPNYTAYSQDIETNAGGFDGGLQKLAGSKWDYYPKLKEVSVDFVSISNNNYFITFPLEFAGTWTNYEDNLTSSSLGVFTAASSFGGFNINIDLEFNNTGNAINYQYNFSIRARPDGDTDWDNGKYLSVQPGLTPTWEDYPDEAAGGSAAVWYDYFIAQGASVWNYYQQYNIHPNVGFVSLPSGTSQHTIFSQQIPTDAAFVGDWEFEIFTIAGYLNVLSIYLWGGHGIAYNSIGLAPGVTYADVLDANNNPVSQFNPILNSVIGGTAINTAVYSARSETQKQEVKDIWWGDTVTNGEPGSLRWDNGSGTYGYTDPTGLWRKGQTGSFDKSITELLCEARLFNQQQSDYKWNLGTAVSETNSWKADASGSRPVYVNPIGRIHDTIDNIFYYLLRGTFNIIKDEWEGEWLQASYDNGISTTTTTTTTGGTNPTNNNASARLSGGGRLSIFNEAIGSLRTRVASWSTVTELEINAMNPIVYQEEGETTLYLFEQNTLIKSGDIFNIVNTANGVWQQFTASADVENTDTTISVTSIELEKPLEVGSKIVVNMRDSFQQLNHKTRGTVAGFTVGSEGITKKGIEITDWLDSDTMEGASDTSLPTSESVKAYVDSQVATSDTLQEVTDNGNTTTNSIMIGSSTSPISTLHLKSTTSPGPIIQLEATANYGADNFIRFGDSNENYSYALGADDTGNSFRLSYNSTSYDGAVLGTNDLLVIDTSGKVGIGTTTPGEKLEVLGNLRMSNAAGSTQFDIVLQSGGTEDVYIKAQRQYTSSLQFGTPSGASGLVIKGQGVGAGNHVGIGTTSPNFLLDVESSGASARVYNTTGSTSLQIQSQDDANGSIDFADSSDNNVGQIIYRHASDSMAFNTNDTERMRITSDGNVGIGTTSPSSYGMKLEVVGGGLKLDDVNFFTTFSAGLAIQCESTNNPQVLIAAKDSIQTNPSVTIFRVTDNTYSTPFFNVVGGGNIGIGTSAPASELHINGAATLTATEEPSDPAVNDCIIWLDSTTLNLMVKITGAESTVTRTIAAFAE